MNRLFYKKEFKVGILIVILAAFITSGIVIAYQFGIASQVEKLTGLAIAETEEEDPGIVTIDFIRVDNAHVPRPSVYLGLSNKATVDAQAILNWIATNQDTGNILDSGQKRITLDAESEGIEKVIFDTLYVGRVRLSVTIVSVISGSKQFTTTGGTTLTTKEPAEFVPSDSDLICLTPREYEDQCGCDANTEQVTTEIVSDGPAELFTPPKMTTVLWSLIFMLALFIGGVIIFQGRMLKQKMDVTNYLKQEAPDKLVEKRIKAQVFEDKIKSIQERLK